MTIFGFRRVMDRPVEGCSGFVDQKTGVWGNEGAGVYLDERGSLKTQKIGSESVVVSGLIIEFLRSDGGLLEKCRDVRRGDARVGQVVWMKDERLLRFAFCRNVRDARGVGKLDELSWRDAGGGRECRGEIHVVLAALERWGDLFEHDQISCQVSRERIVRDVVCQWEESGSFFHRPV